MASIRMVSEDEAEGKVKAVYEEIQRELGISFVPNLYKVMVAQGKIDRLAKEIIAVTVSAVQGCHY